MIVVGIDVGTTGAKALAADENGEILGCGYREYPIKATGDGRVVQNAGDWWEASVFAVRGALSNIRDKSGVAAIGLSTQGATMLASDANGDPLCDAVTWMDTRAKKETEDLTKRFGGENIYKKSGWSPDPSLDASKILWIKKNDPQLFESAACFISTLEFMNIKLTGKNIIDPTNASIRQMTDFKFGRWDPEILDFIGIDETRLPKIEPSGSFIGTLTKKAAEELGIPEHVKVYNGAHDQYCSAIGSGTLKTGETLLATGTTWVAFGVTEEPLYSAARPAPGVFPLTGRYGVIASMVSAGSALKWWKNIIGENYADIDEKAAGRMESAADLFFYPYVAGAGIMHGGEKAALIGMTLSHDKYDISRALMEGVAFEARLLLEEFMRCGMKTKTVTMTGKAAGSVLWREITGYVTGCEIIITKEAEAACMGAAILAAVGLGIYKNLEECVLNFVKREKLELTNKRKYVFYEDKFNKYREKFTDKK